MWWEVCPGKQEKGRKSGREGKNAPEIDDVLQNRGKNKEKKEERAPEKPGNKKKMGKKASFDKKLGTTRPDRGTKREVAGQK